MEYYNDYFNIRPDYTPCMDVAGINLAPDTWLGFYPHDSFVGILRELIKGLNGGNKTLWITGAYGTGKSHASLVLQKLFMDDDSRVKEWLSLRERQIPETVRDALLQQRTDKVLVVYDVNSDGVDAKNQFLMRLQRGITKALNDGGYQIPLKGKLEEVIERIGQDGEYFWAKRDEMQSSLSHLHADIKTTDQLAKKLRDGNLEAGLISDAMRVLEARDIVLSLNAEDYLSWVETALTTNGLSKLVYIWDEFSSFMDRNRSELKTLEQLAEAAQQGKFFFVPVTHTEITSYVAAGSESAKKANNRFAFKQIDLPNETALKLAADAFVVKQEMESKWKEERSVLWHSVNAVAENYMIPNKVGIEVADFEGILPLHPMAAFLLKHLSVVIGANQRSMFDFLNGEEFKNFIANGGLDVQGHQFLTVDHLWSYFIERDDLGTAPAVREVRTEYARRENDLQPEERRAFKTVLLFNLVETMLGDGHPLLCATVENIIRSFEGDGAIHGVEEVLKNLQQKHCFSIYNGRCERFQDRSDSGELEEKRKALGDKFRDLVLKDTETELDRFLRQYNHGGRFVVRATDIGHLTASSITNREAFSKNGNQILVQFVLARNEQKQLQIPDKCTNLSKQFRDHRILFVAVPSLNFCQNDSNAWEQMVDNNARLALADNTSRRVFETQIESMKKGWHDALKGVQNLTIYKPNEQGEPFVETVSWGHIRQGWLADYAKQSFDAYTDDLCGYNRSAIGTPSSLKNWALAGIHFDQFTTSGAWKTVLQTWQNAGITGNAKWFDENPSHPLTKMRDFCKKRQDSTVGAGNPCSIRKLYIDLQRSPFGLLCIPHSAMAMGFVLKTWLSGQRKLQWTDGVVSRTLDADTLAEIIEAVVKDDGANKIKNEKLICRLSTEEKEFIKQSSVIFGTTAISDGTVEAALTSIGTRIEQISGRVPLWVLPDYIAQQNDPNAEAMNAFISAVCEASSISSKGNTDLRGDKVKEAGGLLLKTPGLAEALSKYMIPATFEAAFIQYVDATKPELKEVAARLADESHIYCDEAKGRLAATSGWLWKPNDTEAVLKDVYHEYLSAEHIRELTRSPGYIGFDDARSWLGKAVFEQNKVPTEYWSRKYPALQHFFELLSRTQPSGDDVESLEQVLRQQKDVFRDLFFDIQQTTQLEAMGEIFGELWPNVTSEAKQLYGSFAKASATLDEQSFKEQGRSKIEEFNRSLTSKRLETIWKDRTESNNPSEWSQKHLLPAEFLLNVENSASVIDATEQPSNVSPERLAEVVSILEGSDVFIEETAAQTKFIARVLPSHYQSAGIDCKALTEWLREKLGANPNKWLTDSRLEETVESFVKHHYEQHSRKKALARVKSLSDADAKELLVKLVDQKADVGLWVLE